MSRLTAPGRKRRSGASRRVARRGKMLPMPTIDAQLVLKTLALGLLSIAAGLLVYKAGDVLERPVRQVTVQGDFRYLKQEAVKQAVAPFIHNDYLTVRLGQLRESLEALPWIHRAAVKRNWPDGLNITVEEQKPIAWWGNRLLINNKGSLFSPADAVIAETLPYLEGPVGSQGQVMERYIDLRQTLGSRELSVQSLQLSMRGSWSTALKNGVELVFGSEQVMEKLQRFLAIYDHTLNAYVADIKRVDLRYPNGLAVDWLRKPGSDRQPGSGQR
jgi:cell division protein FtsQ